MIVKKYIYFQRFFSFMLVQNFYEADRISRISQIYENASLLQMRKRE